MFKCEKEKCVHNFKGVCGTYERKPSDDKGRCTAYVEKKTWTSYEFNVGDWAAIRLPGSYEGQVVEIIAKKPAQKSGVYRYLVLFDSGLILDYYGDELEPYNPKNELMVDC